MYLFEMEFLLKGELVIFGVLIGWGDFISICICILKWDVEVLIKCKYDRVDLYLLNFYWFWSVIERCCKNELGEIKCI